MSLKKTSSSKKPRFEPNFASARASFSTRRILQCWFDVAALGAEADPAKGHVTVLLVDGTSAISGGTAEMTVGTADQGPNYTNDDVAAGIFSDSDMTTDVGIAVFCVIDRFVLDIWPLYATLFRLVTSDAKGFG